MMQRIVNAVKSGKHAMLESPTGTGKSAASMSALLAWQVRGTGAKNGRGGDTGAQKLHDGVGVGGGVAPGLNFGGNTPNPSATWQWYPSPPCCFYLCLFFSLSLSSPPVPPFFFLCPPPPRRITPSVKTHTPQRHELVRTGTAPQIFYCVRTHTQVAQMAKEIKRLPYAPTIATLGSR